MLVEDGPVVVDGVETVSGITMAGGAVVTGAAEVVCSHVGSTVDVVVVVEPVVLGTAHGSIVLASAGFSSCVASGVGECVVVVETAGVVSVGWASAAGPPTATAATVVPATRHRCHHLVRGMTE